MGYKQPDFWVTCAQLIVVLWLVVAIEVRPNTQQIIEARVRRAASPKGRVMSNLLGSAIILTGLMSAVALVIALTVLYGVIEPTEAEAFITVGMVIALSAGALVALVEVALRNLGVIPTEQTDPHSAED